MAAGNGTGVPPPPTATMPPFYYQPQQQQQLYGLGRDNHSPEEDGPAAQAAASSPWHRMKWTDAMVCLLIKVVFLMGDDGAQDSEPTTAKGKKATTAAASQHLKKGKWKSVSKEMMEKGFYVSPQQCEDKFNDLNKRYKRVNELIGKGTACRVVENQSLLDLLDHLSPKAKEEARKLLNSKHLFFREMCNYHNGGGAATTAVSAPLPPGCSHHPAGAGTGAGGVVGHGDEDDSVDDDMDMYDEEDDDDDDSHGMGRQQPAFAASPPLSLSLWSGAPAGSMPREWMKRKVEALEEQRVAYQCEALRLERRRFRWERFRGDKEREMEGRRLQNERMRLQNERMLLMLRQKEMEMRGSGGGASGSSVSVQLAGERGQQHGVVGQSNGGMEHHFMGGVGGFDI